MSTDTVKKKPDSIAIKFERAPDFRLYFANNVQVSGGQTGEVQLFFGQITAPAIGHDPSQSMQAEQGVGIAMTMIEFKKMLEVFQRTLERIEKVTSEESE